MRILGTALLVLALPACIELDEELVLDTDPPVQTGTPDPSPGPQRPGATDEPEVPEVQVFLEPATGQLCDILLVSIETDADEPLSPDGILFTGPAEITVLQVTERPGELLVTVEIGASGEGLHDVRVELADGTRVRSDDAFTVSGDGC